MLNGIQKKYMKRITSVAFLGRISIHSHQQEISVFAGEDDV